MSIDLRTRRVCVHLSLTDIVYSQLGSWDYSPSIPHSVLSWVCLTWCTNISSFNLMTIPRRFFDQLTCLSVRLVGDGSRYSYLPRACKQAVLAASYGVSV